MMGRAETVTLLPLDRYREIMGISPAHFNQLAGNKAPLVKGCENTVWDQDDREALAEAMAVAEEMIALELGYWPAPKFIEDEPIPFALPGVRSDWRNAEVRTEWGYVQGYGTEQLTLKQESAGVGYTDDDGDPLGRKELATIGTATIYADLPACGSACEVAVFFRVSDGAEDAADPRWEIRPIKVDIDGTTMNITAEASLFVKPDLWKLTKLDVLGSTETTAYIIDYNITNFVSNVDVYCRTINTQTPVCLKWDGVCGCSTNSPCEHETQTACAYATDNKRGHFVPRPATWNGTTNIEATPTFWQPPESVTVNYRAGYPLNSRTCRMPPQLERAIVKLTNVLLPEPPCGFCDPADNRWREDRKSIDPLTPEAASMPWDLYSRGALEAWRIVKLFARGRGGKMGRGYR